MSFGIGAPCMLWFLNNYKTLTTVIGLNIRGEFCSYFLYCKSITIVVFDSKSPYFSIMDSCWYFFFTIVDDPIPPSLSQAVDTVFKLFSIQFSVRLFNTFLLKHVKVGALSRIATMGQIRCFYLHTFLGKELQTFLLATV